MKKIVKIIPKPIKSILRPLYYRYKYKSRDALFQYWRQPKDECNAPELYVSPIERSQFLLKFIEKYADSQARILEIGCNVGRNLNYLFNAGYKKLGGVEISKEAIDLMKKTYPEMAEQIEIWNSPIEDVIVNFKGNSFDLIFTMAVLEHIHPDSKFIFSEMVRITKKYLITIEDERGISWRHFPRNYKKIFEPLGMKQVEQFNCREIKDFGSHCWVRVFIK